MLSNIFYKTGYGAGHAGSWLLQRAAQAKVEKNVAQ